MARHKWEIINVSRPSMGSDENGYVGGDITSRCLDCGIERTTYNIHGGKHHFTIYLDHDKQRDYHYAPECTNK